MFTLGQDKYAICWNLETQEVAFKFDKNKFKFLAACISKDDSLLVTSDDGGFINVYDIQTQAKILTYKVKETALDLVLVPGNNLIFTGGENHNCSIYNINKEEIQYRSDHSDKVYCTSLTVDEKYIVSAS